MNQPVRIVEPYHALAAVYNKAGLADYSAALIPRLLELAFAQDWVGRTVLDLGCGTGEVACWLAERSYRAIAVDSAQPMLDVGATYTAERGLDVEWTCADIRTFKPGVAIDWALALGGTLNLLPTLQDFESAIQHVYAALDAGKLFIFDVDTIRGLVEDGNVDHIIYDDGAAGLVAAQSRFSYETLTRTTTYRVLQFDGHAWERADETHVQRGFPLAAIVRALTRAGFKLLKTLDTDLNTADPNDHNRLILVAQK
ncbi:MAG: class I SAM-dependent DNA methyltransferase [Aggregatilineales bacterium]